MKNHLLFLKYFDIKFLLFDYRKSNLYYYRVKLEAIKEHVDERTLDMEVIVNPKSLEGAHQGVNVIQLETAVGAAMKVHIKHISSFKFSYHVINAGT